MRKVLRSSLATLLLCGALLASFASGAVAAPKNAAAGSPGCPSGQIRVSTGCVERITARRHMEAMIREAMPEMGLRATILQVNTGTQPLVQAGFGNSMKGTPASPHMYWRIGSIAIPYLIDVLLQLQDEGKLSLDDPLSKYRPNFPEADEVTLRMLASVTSGYPDFIQENEAFQKLLFENPFRQWSPDELIHWAFTLPVVCKPATCFHYAHTNFAILSQVISKVTGRSISALIQERVFGPLGLRHTAITRYPAFPGPGLHAYTGERGIYEDDTFWSPSWSIGAGTVMTATMGDTVRGFRAMARGALISKQANRERISPAYSSHLEPFSPSLYYGLGITVQKDGWQLQNPFIDGYTGIAAYLPAQDLSLGVVTTQLPQSSANGVSYATTLFSRLTEYLSPEHVVKPLR
ncbi:MAG TPA: serine hydrolase domain-containing protein [Solirubrobacterales bacterium]|nr:serine hydrolase domain-containing protein [Solirubrobacterales bacterium]